MPSATRVGKRMSDPPPAIELMTPATKATPAARSRSRADTSGQPTVTVVDRRSRPLICPVAAGDARLPGMTAPDQPALKPMPDDWQRALVVAAHPDDIEYGMAGAAAAWAAGGAAGADQ